MKMAALTAMLRVPRLSVLALSILALVSSPSSWSLETADESTDDHNPRSVESHLPAELQVTNRHATCLFVKQSYSKNNEATADPSHLFEYGISGFCQNEPNATVFTVSSDWSSAAFSECGKISSLEFNPHHAEPTFQKIYINAPDKQPFFDDKLTYGVQAFVHILQETQSSHVLVERILALLFYEQILAIKAFGPQDLNAAIVVAHDSSLAADEFTKLLNKKLNNRHSKSSKTFGTENSTLSLHYTDCSFKQPTSSEQLKLPARTPRNLQAAPPTTWENKATKFQITLWSCVVLVIILVLTLRAALALGNVRDPILRSKLSGLS